MMSRAVKTKKRDQTRLLIQKVDEALKQYGTEIISVDYNEFTQNMDINQCHGSWSSVIFANVISAQDVDMKILLPALGKRSVGYCI